MQFGIVLMTYFTLGINYPFYEMMLSQVSLKPNSKGTYFCMHVCT